ncbi:Lon protease [Trichinella pseudospiralis]
MKRPQILLHNNSNNADNRPMMPVASADVVCEADRQKPIHSFMEAYCRSKDFRCERKAVVKFFAFTFCQRAFAEQCYCFLQDRMSVHGCEAGYLGRVEEII